MRPLNTNDGRSLINEMKDKPSIRNRSIISIGSPERRKGRTLPSDPVQDWLSQHYIQADNAGAVHESQVGDKVGGSLPAGTERLP